MSYTESDGDAILRLSREDYSMLMYLLGVALAACGRETDSPFYSWVAFVNRLNAGNPNYTPYEIPAGEAKPLTNS